jgi:hypothetical protein
MAYTRRRFRMDSHAHDLLLFFGRFHPLLVHLPIGGLVLLGLLEVLARLPRFREAAQPSRLILGFVAAGSVAAALAGWMLSQGGDYDPQLLRWHKWSGFTLAAACALAWLLNWLGWPRAYRLALLVGLVVLVVAGHFGASLTHGRGFMTAYAPGPLRRLFSGGEAARPAAPSAPSDLTPQRVFAEVVHSMLLNRCSACHGPERQKAGLRVDTLEALLRGGESGPALLPGRSRDSLLLKRLLLPLQDEDHMPPEGKPQPTLAEILAVQWWIDHGAPPAALRP